MSPTKAVACGRHIIQYLQDEDGRAWFALEDVGAAAGYSQKSGLYKYEGRPGITFRPGTEELGRFLIDLPSLHTLVPQTRDRRRLALDAVLEYLNSHFPNQRVRPLESESKEEANSTFKEHLDAAIKSAQEHLTGLEQTRALLFGSDF